MLRDAPFVEGEIYHLYTRGVEKREIFLSDFDRKRFQLSLFLSNNNHAGMQIRNTIKIFEDNGATSWGKIYQEYEKGEPFVDILAYVLMPNHFHILVKEHIPEGGGISKFMQKIMNSHTGYFNKANERTGALFEGTFKSKHVNDEAYFRWLFSYIHLNPLKLIEPGWREGIIRDMPRAIQFLNNYAWSSFPDYAGVERPEGVILTKDALPEYVTLVKDVEGLIAERATHIPSDTRRMRFS
ncbi:MAG: hypothetical protein HGB03_00210 [Candidatus Yonathbacteria bacterium]|nr:hypothetical protein [Candidatus Yonathbacteria bacterium]NTW48103.1 hypothetical protein [Candidatus Yonathbacteria bacterium]